MPFPIFMRILVDMDNVIADFDERISEVLKANHPEISVIPLEQRTTFYIRDQYPEEHHPALESIYLGKGFYRNLPIIEGSLEALEYMLTLGHDVRICTRPLLRNPYCVQEKYEWVDENLIKEWLHRVVISKDKTIVKGDLLIDDKPEIKGIEIPSWEHILYTQPYNLNVNSKRRLTWKDYKDVLAL